VSAPTVPAVVIRTEPGRATAWGIVCSECGPLLALLRRKTHVRITAEAHLRRDHDGYGRIIDHGQAPRR
jgi:hypothetical protein